MFQPSIVLILRFWCATLTHTIFLKQINILNHALSRHIFWLFLHNPYLLLPHSLLKINGLTLTLRQLLHIKILNFGRVHKGLLISCGQLYTQEIHILKPLNSAESTRVLWASYYSFKFGFLLLGVNYVKIFAEVFLLHFFQFPCGAIFAFLVELCLGHVVSLQDLDVVFFTDVEG